MVRLSLFRTLRLFFLYQLAYGAICLLQNQISVANLCLMSNLVFPSDCYIFPLLWLYYRTTAHGEEFETPSAGKCHFLMEVYTDPIEWKYGHVIFL